MGKHIHKLTVKGFKSIKCLEDFELKNLNVMIGANGAGKSNFVEFFLVVRTILGDFYKGNKDYDELYKYIKKNGDADKFLYLGPKVTDSIKIELAVMGKSQEVRLTFKLECTSDNKFLVHHWVSGETTGIKTSEERAAYLANETERVHKNLMVYHFHDTSDTAGVKRLCSKTDNEYLRPDASNLAAFLYKLKKKNAKEYQRIRETIQLAAPFFDDFRLIEWIDDPDKIRLEWRQKHSDYPFVPSQLSDGTLRFMCLATALLQPEPPSIILLDEPELGLHPYALWLLAEMVKKASHKTQVIVSTQSATLIDHFEPGDIVVVDRKDGQSTFKRLNASKLKDWLEDYTLGQLWQKNLLEGGPVHE